MIAFDRSLYRHIALLISNTVCCFDEVNSHESSINRVPCCQQKANMEAWFFFYTPCSLTSSSWIRHREQTRLGRRDSCTEFAKMQAVVKWSNTVITETITQKGGKHGLGKVSKKQNTVSGLQIYTTQENGKTSPIKLKDELIYANSEVHRKWPADYVARCCDNSLEAVFGDNMINKTSDPSQHINRYFH